MKVESLETRTLFSAVTATVVVADSTLIVAETAEVTITFDQPVTGFSNDDLTVANCALTSVVSTDGGTVWTATLTPDASVTDSTNVITLDLSGVMGTEAGVGTTDSNNYAIDTARPTVTIVVADTSLVIGETSLVTFTFNEAVTGLLNNDLTIVNGTLSAVSSAGNGLTWTATFTPAASVTDATNVITLAVAGVDDLAGNAGSGMTDSNNFAIDTVRPTATIVVADTSLMIGETSLVTFTFSEAVTGFANDDLTIANGTLSAVSSADNGLTWTATFTPTTAITDATNVITLAAAGVDDLAGNAGSGTTDSNNFAIDTARPTATIVVADTSLVIGETSLVTFTFDEAVTGLLNNDLTIVNGTLSAVSSAGNGLTWTATFTPAASVTDATNVITLAVAGVDDLAGNAGSGMTDSNNFAIDTVRPTATIVVADTSLMIGETSLVTFTFSEAVTGFANDDLTIANGTLSAVSSTDNGLTWTATFTPTTAITDATNVITLAAAGVDDLAGNAGSGTTDSNNFAIDTARPTTTIVVVATSLITGEASLVTFTFSEAVTGFTNSDLTIVNGTLTAVSTGDGGLTWTAVYTPSNAVADDTNVITLDGTGVMDAAGNTGSGTTDSNNFAIDTARPTATIVVADASLMIGETSLVTFTFSEAVTGFTNTDLTVINGTLSPVVTADSGLTWTATFTPATAVTDATNIVTLANIGVIDLAGNNGTGTSSSNNFAIDTARPTATIVVADTALRAGETSPVTFTFSESVTGFTNSDLTIVNGTLTAVSSADNGLTWTATFTPAAPGTDGTNVITLDNTGVDDLAGNAGTSTTSSNNFAIDTARPTVNIVVADTALKIGDTSLVTFTFSEPVTGFTNSDLTIVNGTLSAVASSNGGVAWTATYTPNSAMTDTTNVITLNNTGVVDVAGNTGAGTTNSNNFSIDTNRPTATIVVADVSLTIGETSLVTIAFSEPVTGFTNGDLIIVNGTSTPFSSANNGLTWTAIFTPTALLTDTTNVIALDGTGVVDLAGNAGTVMSTSNNFAIDTRVPEAASLVVTTNSDIINQFDNLTSLREAIIYANTKAGVDAITFGNGTAIAGGTNFIDATPDTILLALGQMVISDTVTITGTSASNTMINAQQLSRIFDISAGSVTLNGLTLKNGRTTAASEIGGAIRSTSTGTLIINSSVLSGNSTTGANATGGAIFAAAGAVTVNKTTLSGNSTTGNGAAGGAIFANSGALTVSQSTLSGNSTTGNGGNGGAIFAGSGTLTISQSTISGNSTVGSAAGGAIFANSGQVMVSQSTLTLNSAAQNLGGAIMSASSPITIRNSIVAGNADLAGASNISKSSDAIDAFIVRSSLIGRNDGTGLAATVGATPDANGNYIGGATDALKIDPKLGPLANNGGSTRTHTLLIGSLAIEHGSNAFAVDVANGNAVLTTDQRGAGFTRIVESDQLGTPIVDMGAVEVPGILLVQPAAFTLAVRPTLQWTPIAGATAYNVWVDRISTTTTSQFYRASNIVGESQTVTKDFPIGKYRVWVQPVYGATNGYWNAPSDIYVLTPPAFMSVPATQVVSRPTISWNALPGAVNYDVWVDRVSPAQSQLIRQLVTTTSFTPSADLTMGSYRVWIRGIDAIGTAGVWSPVYNMNVLPTVAPAGTASTTFDRTPTFAWIAVPGAARYEVTVRNATTSAIVYNAQSTTTTSWTPTVDLPNGPYKWSVVAVSSVASGGLKSAAVTSDIYVGGRPTIVAPLANSSSSVKTPAFTWRPVDGAASYELWVDRTDVPQTKILFRTGLTATSFTAPAALPVGIYRVWVRAVSGTGTFSIYSQDVRFTIIAAAAPGVETVLPESQLTSLLRTDLTQDKPLVPSRSVSEFDEKNSVDAAAEESAAEVADQSVSLASRIELASNKDELPSSDVDRLMMEFAVNAI